MQVFAKLSLVLGLLAVTTKASPINETELFKHEPTVDELFNSMQKHDHGIVILSGDGVLRCFAPNQTVLSYAQLSPPQIEAVVKEYGHDDKLASAFAGVDGHDVVNSKHLSHPDKHLLPVIFPETPSDHIQIVAPDTELPPTSQNPAVHDRAALKPRKTDVCFDKKTPCTSKDDCSPECPACYAPRYEVTQGPYCHAPWK